MTIYIDIDDTICYRETQDFDYTNAKPIKKAIDKANELYDNGHTIVYWTARGTMTGVDWRKITEQQFQRWGIKYHDLKFDKPAYDLFIDDKNMNSKDWWELIDNKV